MAVPRRISSIVATCPLGALLLLQPLPVPAQQPTAGDPVGAHAIPVRSIDITHDDFSDLEPLVGLIGDARVVALGESSHGSGSDFRAKARLIRFLHERMGFDVVLWEAGIYDMGYVSSALRSGAPTPRAAEEGLYAHWAAAEEVASLLDYLKEQSTAGRPVEIAGFDLQISRPFQNIPRLIDDLRAVFATAHGSLLPGETLERLEALRRSAAETGEFAARVRNQDAAGDSLASTYRALSALAPELLRTMDRGADTLAFRHSPRRIELVRQMLRGLEGLNRIDEPLPGDPDRPRWDFVRRWNEREIVNAANIDWYVHSRYPDRRIVIWAHNAHLVEGFLTSDFSAFSTTAPAELPIRPSGPLIRTALGSELFTIIFSGYEGVVRRMRDALALTSDTVHVAPVPEGSIEARLHSAGLSYAVLPLGAARDTLATWLETPRLGRIDTEFLPPQSVQWSRVADAMFFIDRVRPSTITSGRGDQ